MVRDFTANFLAQAAAVRSAPYFVLEIEWHDEAYGTTYFLDRAAGNFLATGMRHPAAIHSARVTEWGATSLNLKEQQIGAVDGRSITIDDDGLLVGLLQQASQQRSKVRLWRLFDHASCVWPTDAALVFSGALKPWAWRIDGNSVTLPVEDASARLFHDVSHRASPTIFPTVQEPFKDRHLPLVWGEAKRVPAVCVAQPWVTSILENAGVGREASGGGASGAPCPQCSDGTPLYWTVAISGIGSGACLGCSAFNITESSIPRASAGSCSWRKLIALDPYSSTPLVIACDGTPSEIGYMGNVVTVAGGYIEARAIFRRRGAFGLYVYPTVYFRYPRVGSSCRLSSVVATPYLIAPQISGICDFSGATATLTAVF